MSKQLLDLKRCPLAQASWSQLNRRALRMENASNRTCGRFFRFRVDCGSDSGLLHRFSSCRNCPYARKVHFLPLWLAPWLLSGLLLDTLVATGVNILNYRIPQEVLTSPTTFSAILPPSLLHSAFGPLVTLAVFFVLLGTALGIWVSIPWTMACRAKLRSHALMLLGVS